MMKTSQFLKKAKALISEPHHWIQRTYARDRRGMACSVTSRRAESFCMLGALNRVSFNHPYTVSIFLKAERRLGRVIGDSIAVFNDDPGTAHSAVLSAFDRAIILSEGEGD